MEDEKIKFDIAYFVGIQVWFLYFLRSKIKQLKHIQVCYQINWILNISL